MRRTVLSRRIAWATKEARMRLIESAATNLRALLDGHPINAVD
jgi:glycerate dehydrogenase